MLHAKYRFAKNLVSVQFYCIQMRNTDFCPKLLIFSHQNYSNALLNLGSSDPCLRSAAYNLLCALTQTFDLRIEGQLLETSGKFSIHIGALLGMLGA